jgi:hypothetical protein
VSKPLIGANRGNCHPWDPLGKMELFCCAQTMGDDQRQILLYDDDGGSGLQSRESIRGNSGGLLDNKR